MGEVTSLGGMTAIREFVRTIGLQSSEASVIYFVVCCEFPAKKLNGQWTSDKEEILIWHKRFIKGEIVEKQPEVGRREKTNRPKKTGDQRKRDVTTV